MSGEIFAAAITPAPVDVESRLLALSLLGSLTDRTKIERSQARELCCLLSRPLSPCFICPRGNCRRTVVNLELRKSCCAPALRFDTATHQPAKLLLASDVEQPNVTRAILFPRRCLVVGEDLVHGHVTRGHAATLFDRREK